MQRKPRVGDMKILNLGCGNKVSDNANVINIDWSPYLRLRQNPMLRGIARLYLSGERLKRFTEGPGNILVADLSKGIPFDDESVDAVYHSHFLEHLDHDKVPLFLQDVLRVLKSGGIHRIVVPDLEQLCRNYLASLEQSRKDTEVGESHDSFVAAMIEQCVRKESAGTKAQSKAKRWLENMVLGDARRRGETHQWMYDRLNLTEILLSTGFSKCEVMDYQNSRIENWDSMGLDRSGQHSEYKPGSLYLEAVKP